MTQLLVSVRSAAEAEIALAGGADLIDIKEPARGSLGAADAGVVSDVLRVVDGRRPVSAAGGELMEGGLPGRSRLPDGTWEPFVEDNAPWRRPGPIRQTGPTLALFKFGLAGCANTAAWPTRWLTLCGGAPRRCLVAVVYADWQAADAPSPGEVLAAAQAHGATVALVDTWDKAAGDLLAHWSVDEVRRFGDAAHERKLAVAIAGSLTFESIGRLLPGPFDWIAVRGAACRAGRNSPVDLACVRRLARLVHGTLAARSTEPTAESEELIAAKELVVAQARP